MRLDIRLPIGLLFAFLGLLLIGFGLLGDGSVYRRSLGININAWWGVAMLAFGTVMLVLGRRGSSAVRSTDEARKIEERERREGLEKPSAGGS
jgi:hypothetical protein